MKFLLDSNPIIYYLNQQLPPAGRAFVDQLTIDGAAYSVMTRLEVLGFRMLPNQRIRSERMLELFTELPIDDLVIDTAISLRTTLKIKAMDALIASTVLNRNLPQSTPTRLDTENPNFGRVSACKRVARALYMGTAPDADALRKGIGDQRVKLACVMPGEPIGVFGDAMRRLGDRGRFIQQDGDRYWIDTRPNLNRTAEEHRESYLRQREELTAELNTRLAQEATKRGDFAGLHAAPLDTSAVPDEPATRLVLLAAQHTHRRSVEFSAARQWASACLQSRGNSPRQFANTLIFLAADEASLENLFHALADRRAWQHIIDNKLELNLTEAQKNQAIGKIAEATQAVASRIPETWCHLLIPYQSQPGPGGALWDEKKLTSGKGSLAERASERFVQEDVLFLQLGARRLRDDLNRFLWIDKPHVAVRDLVDWTRKYLFLPRVASDQVILNALVVKDEVALAQIEADRLAEDGRLQIATELCIQQAARLQGLGCGETGPGLLKPAIISGPGSIGTPPPPPPPPPLARLPTT